MLLEARLDRGLDLVDMGDERLDLAAGGDVEERDPRAGAGGVAGRGDLGEVAVGDHAEDHRVLRRDMRAEGAGEHDPVDGVGAELVHQQPRPGVERGLRELDGADVALRHQDVAVQPVGVGAALRDAALGAGLLGRADQPRGVDEARRRASRRSTSMMPEPQMPVTRASAGKAGSSDQGSTPMMRKRGSLLTGSISTRSMAPGAARWPEEICAPSKAGPGGRGAGEDAVAVAEQDLGVGADVDDEHQLVGELRRLGEGDRGGVGADVAGDAGQEVDAARPGAGGARSPRPRLQRVGGGQREGRLAELGRVDAEHEVVHDRVADDHRLEDQLARSMPASAAAWPASSFSAARTAFVISSAPPGFIIA